METLGRGSREGRKVGSAGADSDFSGGIQSIMELCNSMKASLVTST